MSTKIFVVCWTRLLGEGKQAVQLYNGGVRGHQRFAKDAGPGRGHIGLGRALSKLGFCSRSQAFEMIRAGRVWVKGGGSKKPGEGGGVGEERVEGGGGEGKRAEKVCWGVDQRAGRG